MNITKKDLIFLLLIVLSFYLNRRPIEKLVNISKDSDGNYVIPGNLVVKGAGTFGTSVNRKLVIKPSTYGTNSTGIEFYTGDKRTGYLVPQASGQLVSSGNLFLNPGKKIIMDKCKLSANNYGALKINTPYGYASIGPENKNFCHIYTDKPTFAFNKSLTDVRDYKNYKEYSTNKGLDASTEAIRNLSSLANNLTKNGKLVVPGGLEVQGKISCNSLTANKSIYASTTIQAEKGLYGGNLVVVGDAKINTGKKAKGDILQIMHPDGGYIYFNSGPTLGTWKIPNKDLTIASKNVNSTNVTASKIVSNNSIYSANTIQAENGLYGKNLTISNSGKVGGQDILTFNRPVYIKTGSNGHFSGQYFHTHNNRIVKASDPKYKTQYTFEM